MHYHIRVQGHLDPSWQHRFEGLQIKHEGSGTTLLSGPLPDQAALHGVLLSVVCCFGKDRLLVLQSWPALPGFFEPASTAMASSGERDIPESTKYRYR